MADEQRHSVVAFTLASAYAGHLIGPGPLPIDNCLDGVSLSTTTTTAFLEGCIGEVVAAIDVTQLAQQETDPDLCDVLTGIADDEARHAALAWRFLRWAIEQGGAELVALLEQTVADEVVRTCSDAGLRARVLDEVVRPCFVAVVAVAA